MYKITDLIEIMIIILWLLFGIQLIGIAKSDYVNNTCYSKIWLEQVGLLILMIWMIRLMSTLYNSYSVGWNQ